mgnify:CR=1 FL=1
MKNKQNPPKDTKKNYFKQLNNEIPVENHETAAWTNGGNVLGEGRVINPDFIGVEQAKEYVDQNQK